MKDVKEFACFEQVAEVIGDSRAMRELGKVSGVSDTNPNIRGAFLWEDTPQGHNFWSDISMGRIPREIVEEETTDEGVAVRPFYTIIRDLPNGGSTVGELIALMKGEVDYIEFENDPEEWASWVYFGVDEYDRAVFWNNRDSYGRSASRMNYEQILKILPSSSIPELPQEYEDELEDEDESGSFPFCVHLGGMSKSYITKFVSELISKGSDLFSYIEYEDLPEEWLNWHYVGGDEEGGLEFWDSSYHYGADVNLLTPEQALELVSEEAGAKQGSGVSETPKPDFPDFTFKIRNADDPQVRQWLKDNGLTWCSGDDLTTYLVEKDLLLCYPNNGDVAFISETGFYEENHPELDLTISTVVQVNWKEYVKTDTELRIEELEKELERLKAST